MAMNFFSTISSQQWYYLDKWEYKKAEDETWKSCNLPNSIYNILNSDGFIENPYWQDQEVKIAWVDEQTWLFRTRFDLDTALLNSSTIESEFEGLDGYAEIYLNHSKILVADNSFRNWRTECKNLLLEKNNLLEIRFNPTLAYAKQKYSELAYPLPGSERVMLRKPQFLFGWDFGPKMTGCAIRNLPRLKFTNQIIVEDFRIHTQEIGENQALLELIVNVQSPTNGQGNLLLEIDKDSFLMEFEYDAGRTEHAFEFVIYNPKLWWPSGQGEPFMHHASLSLFDKTQTILKSNMQKKFGIRTITLIQEPDDFGKSFYFLVNGKAIFIKGANYVPADVLDLYHKNPDSFIKSLAKSNFNMIRVWGGGSYEKDSFYTACDQYGIMVWQDFMYACAMYPGHVDFLNNAAVEAKEQVSRLSSHPSIALWCGNNESNEAWHNWGWQKDMSKKTSERIWFDYQKLFQEILPGIVKENGNRISYIESSPLYGRGDPRFKSEGDAHDWGIWHDEMPFEVLKSRVPRFMSEFGFQSFPDVKTLSKFVDENDLHLDSKILLSHQKHPKGQQIIETYSSHEMPAPKDLVGFVYLNQVLQADGIGQGVIEHRMAKPYCMGTLYWQLNDCWPGISWSSIDHDGNWKALHHRVSHLYQPILCQLKVDGNSWTLVYSSDLVDQDSLKIKLRIIDIEGKEYFQWKTSMIPDAEQANTIYQLNLLDFIDQPEDKMIFGVVDWEYKDFSSQNIYFNNVIKNIEFKKPKFEIDSLHASKTGFKFKIKADQFVKATWLQEIGDLKFYPNYFDLAPQEWKEIFVSTEQFQLNASQLKIKSMFDFQNN
ncbi:MAG: glycoside hydrolase family 2 protein [Saprospiraceae bacterium]|nr:glycoside hydrolase family 2 protein [Saprospiraceae bacterium]